MKLSPVFVGFTVLAAAGHAQIIPGSTGHGAPTFNCAANDYYKDVDSGLVWQCKTPPTGWAPTPQFVPWQTPTNGQCLVGNGNTFTTGSCGSGSGIPASQLALVTAESFGAVGDWNGTTGTDNTTALQNAINSLQTGGICGQVLLQAKLYKITGTLNITSSCVGIRGTAQGGAFFVNNPSGLITTSASADILDLNGTNPAGVLEYNTIQNVVLMRSVAPTGTATGLSLNFVAGAVVENVQVMDSARGMYLHYVPSRGSGRIENCTVSWGYGNVTGYTGTMSGYYLDSSDGNAMFSFRGRHLLAASGLARGSGTHGMDVIGSAIQDVMVDQLETAVVDVGINVSHTGSTAFTGADLHFNNSILDNSTTGVLVSNVTAAVTGRIEFNGGYIVSPSGTGPAVDLESSSGIDVTNIEFGPEGTAANWILLNGTTASSVTNNSLQGVTTKAITLIGSSGNSIVGNQITGSSASSLINLTSTSLNNALSANTLSGTATTGTTVDAGSLGNSGISTTNAGSGITTNISTAATFYERILGTDSNGAPEMLLSNTNSAGYPQLGFQNNTDAGTATVTGGFFLGGSTIASPFTNTLWMYNTRGGLYLRGNGAITINANTTATPAITDLGVANTHLVQAGYGFQSTGTKFTTTGCSISSTTGGGTAGTFTLGANSCTAVITMNGATGATATNGWSCQAHDRTAPTILIGGESSSTTTTASFTIPAGAGATDVISFGCTAF
jgi:hypothetical protein